MLTISPPSYRSTHPGGGLTTAYPPSGLTWRGWVPLPQSMHLHGPFAHRQQHRVGGRLRCQPFPGHFPIKDGGSFACCGSHGAPSGGSHWLFASTGVFPRMPSVQLDALRCAVCSKTVPLESELLSGRLLKHPNSSTRQGAAPKVDIRD